MYYSVAIDGPSGAGKSTLARRIAEELGFLYVDTGALYRALALAAQRAGITPDDEVAVEALLARTVVDLAREDGVPKVLLQGEDVSEAIRAHEISKLASDLSALPVVRAFLLQKQRDFTLHHNVIMDGRDIGTVVLPDANVKIFLTADTECRARRRYDELMERGQDVSFEDVYRDVLSRDENDSRRALAPLRPAEDALIVNTTGNAWALSLRILLDTIRSRLSLPEPQTLSPE